VERGATDFDFLVTGCDNTGEGVAKRFEASTFSLLIIAAK